MADTIGRLASSCHGEPHVFLRHHCDDSARRIRFGRTGFPMNEEYLQKVRERAHALWEQAGRPHGQDAEHWAQAEREIAAEEDAQPSASVGKATGRRGRKARLGVDRVSVSVLVAKPAGAAVPADDVSTDTPKATRGREPKAVAEEGAGTVKAARNRRSKPVSEEGTIVPVETRTRKTRAAAEGKGDAPKVVAEGSDTAE